MKYGTIKSNILDTKRYISFRIIEEVVVYNEGQTFNEYTRFRGSELFVQWNNRDDIKLVDNEDDASVFSKEDNPQGVYLLLIDKLKSGEIKGEGIQVIEYDELHKRSSEVLQYPNNHYPDGIQPISIYDGKYSRTCHEAVERKNRELRHIAYCDFLDYVESRGWKIKNEDWYYIDNLDASGLRHLLEKNIGRNDLYIPNRRR
jgi:hypothetical protein